MPPCCRLYIRPACTIVSGLHDVEKKNRMSNCELKAEGLRASQATYEHARARVVHTCRWYGYMCSIQANVSTSNNSHLECLQHVSTVLSNDSVVCRPLCTLLYVSSHASVSQYCDRLCDQTHWYAHHTEYRRKIRYYPTFTVLSFCRLSFWLSGRFEISSRDRVLAFS